MRRFFIKLFRRRALEQDLEAELAFHREMATAHNNPIPLGNVTGIRDQAFDLWRFTVIENIWRDLVYAARGLRRSPGFTLSALVSLGLGIGVNTAMFSIAVEFLLSEPSVTHSRSLAAIRIGGGSHAKPAAVDFLKESGAFLDVAGENEETFLNWQDGQETRRIFSTQTTKNYFTVLGVPLALGRGWTSSDPDTVVVLRHEFWRKQFSSDPSIVGRTLMLNGRSYTVLGILPESHRTLLGFGYSPDVYVPRFLEDTMLAIYARLKPGMSIAEARAALRTVAVRMDQALPDRHKYVNGLRVMPIAGFARFEQEQQLMTIGAFFAVLLVLVGLVLLIACVNVASLLLVRTSVRRREIAIRLSIGASRGRLLQQLLAESLLLSLLGAGIGFLLAQLVAKALATIRLPIPIPIQLHIQPDWRVATYAATLCIGTTIACGLLPAWQSVRDSLTQSLHRERKLRLRRALVIAQIAVSVIVLATGSLFLRNLLMATSISPGFDVRRTLRAQVFLPPEAYRESLRKSAYYEAALRELQVLPGIEAVAAARIIPFTDSTRYGSDLVFPDTGEKKPALFHWNAVSPGFFNVMSIPVLAGRAFTAEDRAAGAVVIVNKIFVDRYLNGRNAIGARFIWGEGKTPHQVVGVVAGTKNMTIGEEDQPQLYQPLAQIENNRTRLQFVMRSATPPVSQMEPVRQALRRIEPAAGLEVSTLYSSIGLAFLPSQVGAALMGGIGALGLLLAIIGLYGVTAYSVARRSREFGIRIAIGAASRSIAGIVIIEAGYLLLIGSAVGLLFAFFITKPLAMFFVPGLSTVDPLSFFAVAAVLTAAGVAATLGPVLRAVRVDPVTSLRYE